MTDPEMPNIYPFTMLKDLDTFMAWREEVGADNFSDILEAASFQAMKDYGIRVALPIAQRMHDLTIAMEEFS
jgi:hypothetical protein